MATVAELGGRVLRRLGVAAVPAGDRPSPGPVTTVAEVAQRALRLVGANPVPAGSRPHASSTPSGANDVARLALLRLEVIASDEAPSIVDMADAVGAAGSVHEGLNALGLVSWTIDNIPASAVRHYALMAAQLLAPGYGKAADMALYAAAQEVLRLMALSGPLGQRLAEEKVASVHHALVAAGLVDWQPTAIPAAHAEDYAALAAARLAPTLGKAFDPGDAEARVRRASLLRLAPGLAEQKLMAVHAQLDAVGRARWGVNDIPDYVEEGYVVLAANLLAPEFGLPADAVAEARALRDLAAAASLQSSGARIVVEYF